MESINRQIGAQDEFFDATKPVEPLGANEELRTLQALLLNSPRTEPQTASLETSSDTNETSYDPDEDRFLWVDAAEWRDVVTFEAADFYALPDEAIGDPATTGWYGLQHHGQRPGGTIFSENPCGRRNSWSTDSDTWLAQEWNDIQLEHQAFVAATEPHDPEDSEQSWRPQILVGTLRGSDRGHPHQAWLDAALGGEELHQAIDFLLRNSCEEDVEDWAVFDYRAFPYGLNLVLGECPYLTTVSKIAMGIAEHGPAFAAWAAYIGVDDNEALDHFLEQYHGEYESLEDYAAHLSEQAGGDEVIGTGSETLRRYLLHAIEAHAPDQTPPLRVVEAPNGHLWVFDTRLDPRPPAQHLH